MTVAMAAIHIQTTVAVAVAELLLLVQIEVAELVERAALEHHPLLRGLV
jgi:hypothetical protein